MTAQDDIAGLILAGGGSRRFGGKSKAFATLHGQPLIAYALRPFRALKHVAISANADQTLFEPYARAILADEIPGCGPLGGIYSGLFWAASLLPRVRWLASIAVDVPFLPEDLLTRLHAQSDGAAVVVYATAADMSPVCALWSLDQRDRMAEALAGGIRKMSDYLELVSWRSCELPTSKIDPLFNINDHRDLAEAENLTSQLG